MREKKYTPGPWKAVESRNDSYGHTKDCPIWIEGDDWVLASIVDDVEYIDGKSNARLISCAPELLDMLEKAADIIGIDEPEFYGCAMDLISKAKGESQ